MANRVPTGPKVAKVEASFRQTGQSERLTQGNSRRRPVSRSAWPLARFGWDTPQTTYIALMDEGDPALKRMTEQVDGATSTRPTQGSLNHP